MRQVMYSLSKKKVKNLAAQKKAKECDQYPYFSGLFYNYNLFPSLFFRKV